MAANALLAGLAAPVPPFLKPLRSLANAIRSFFASGFHIVAIVPAKNQLWNLSLLSRDPLVRTKIGRPLQFRQYRHKHHNAGPRCPCILCKHHLGYPRGCVCRCHHKRRRKWFFGRDISDTRIDLASQLALVIEYLTAFPTLLIVLPVFIGILIFIDILLCP